MTESGINEIRAGKHKNDTHDEDEDITVDHEGKSADEDEQSDGQAASECEQHKHVRGPARREQQQQTVLDRDFVLVLAAEHHEHAQQLHGGQAAHEQVADAKDRVHRRATQPQGHATRRSALSFLFE